MEPGEFIIQKNNIEGIYKNLLDNFNPSARDLVTSAKAYLKALHGSSAASSLYLESLQRLIASRKRSVCNNNGKDSSHSNSNNSNSNTVSSVNDNLGNCLEEMAIVFKDIHSQQLQVLKAFYVDYIVPIESNLDKDKEVIQSTHRKFTSSSKHRLDNFSKAASTVKKMKKKTRSHYSSTITLDKEIKGLQTYEEERAKIQAFFEHHNQEALDMESRRYIFILERQASVAKQYLSLYSRGCGLLKGAVERWNCTSNELKLQYQQTQNHSLALVPYQGKHQSQEMKKSQSSGVCSHCNNCSSNMVKETSSGMKKRVPLTLSKSETCLNKAPPKGANSYAKAMYAYHNHRQGETSLLEFDEGDLIALSGSLNKKGWQFGENIRTGRNGWFPGAYIVPHGNTHSSPNGSGNQSNQKDDDSNTVILENIDELGNDSPLLPPLPPPLPPSNNFSPNITDKDNYATVQPRSRANKSLVNYSSSNEDSGIGGHGRNNKNHTHHQDAITLPDIDYYDEDDVDYQDSVSVNGKMVAHPHSRLGSSSYPLLLLHLNNNIINPPLPQSSHPQQQQQRSISNINHFRHHQHQHISPEETMRSMRSTSIARSMSFGSCSISPRSNYGREEEKGRRSVTPTPLGSRNRRGVSITRSSSVSHHSPGSCGVGGGGGRSRNGYQGHSGSSSVGPRRRPYPYHERDEEDKPVFFMKRLLNRTKSLILGTGNKSTSAGSFKSRDLHPLYRRSVNDIHQEIYEEEELPEERELSLWGSHDSIVEIKELQEIKYTPSDKQQIIKDKLIGTNASKSYLEEIGDEDESTTTYSFLLKEKPIVPLNKQRFTVDELSVSEDGEDCGSSVFMPLPPPPPPLPAESPPMYKDKQSKDKKKTQTKRIIKGSKPGSANKVISQGKNAEFAYTNTASMRHNNYNNKYNSINNKMSVRSENRSGMKTYQKSERTGNLNGPWYDLWGEDEAVAVKRS